VQFFLIYIREAHAIDSERPIEGNGAPIVEDPGTDEERAAVASECVLALDLGDMPTLIDDMEDTANAAYSGWPDRLYLVDEEGVVAYQGGPGPRGFSPDELEDAIRREMGLPAIEREEAPRRRRPGGARG